MRRGILAVAAAVTTVMATGGSSAAIDPWRELYRPIRVPSIESGTGCPVSPVDDSVDFQSFGIGPGIGRGPVYPLLGDGTLLLSPASRFGSRRWLGQKVLWFVRREYRGPVLIRGIRVDGRFTVRFDRGDVPRSELRIKPNETVYWTDQPPGSRGRPSYTRLRAPGCYAYQVDGTSFSRVIVFRALRG